MAMRYRAESEGNEVTPPKPRTLPPLGDGERPSSSSGGAGGAEVSPPGPRPSKGETEDAAEPITKPTPPPGPRPAQSAPRSGGRTYIAADSEQDPKAVTPAEFDNRGSVERSSKFAQRKSLTAATVMPVETSINPRSFLQQLYVQAEQKILWLELQGHQEERDPKDRVKTIKMESLSAMKTMAFDQPDDEQEMETDDLTNGARVEGEMKSVQHAERRKSAFILDLDVLNLQAQGDVESVRPPEEPGTGGSGGDDPIPAGSAAGDAGSAPDMSFRRSASGSSARSEVCEAEVPHPMKKLLTVKKIKVQEVRALLQTFSAPDLKKWMETPLDLHAKPAVPIPLVVAVADSNPSLVELLVEFGADVTKPYTGEAMYKGWVKPNASLSESVANRKGRFVGTMLADKLEQIEKIFAEAAKSELDNVAQEQPQVEVTWEKTSSGRKRLSYIVNSDAIITTKHTQGHPKERFEIMEHLGDGDTSTVWAGWSAEDHSNDVAIKCESKSDEVSIWDEIVMMRKLRHPNIAALYETYENDEQVFMILELCRGGRLYDAVGMGGMPQGIGSMPKSARSPKLLKQFVEAVVYLHRKSICHRDIQLENFLLQEEGRRLDEATVKLIDFTTAKEYGSGQELVTKVCMPTYVAREILTRRMEPYTEKVDVWSLGVVFFILLSGGATPFPGDTDFNILKLVKKAAWSFSPAEAWQDASKEGMQLIEKMICHVDTRFSAQEVLEQPFFIDQ
eukprot:TRINITY_DN82882_c0_g1_i1.p1 TRINITY_DN82882_c0_g1~~TRINITY_DN82882_c0_g1_i1.p1  ORF type:complete len:756 (+),score=167.28 TRINITY_DN82882_c0_g1_i1:67-2268(+)